MFSAKRLAFTRIVVCAALIIASLSENASALAWLPASMRVSLGLFDLIPETFSRSPLIWTLVDIFVPLGLLIALLGYRTRISLLIGTSAYFFETGLLRAHSYLYHPGLVPMQMAFLLTLTPCGDTLSLDARWHPTNKSRNDAVYRWALLLVWMPLGLTYLMAGLNKLRYSGLTWVAPDNLRGYVAENQEHALLPAAGWINSIPNVIWTALAVFTVVTELGYISIFWSHRARWIFPACTALLHIGIWLLLGAVFPDLILVQAAIFPWEDLWSYATRFWSGASSRFLPSSG